MHHLRPVFAEHPMRFGRRIIHTSDQAVAKGSELAADLKLFTLTFLAGFLFVSILIG